MLQQIDVIDMTEPDLALPQVPENTQDEAPPAPDDLSNNEAIAATVARIRNKHRQRKKRNME